MTSAEKHPIIYNLNHLIIILLSRMYATFSWSTNQVRGNQFDFYNPITTLTTTDFQIESVLAKLA